MTGPMTLFSAVPGTLSPAGSWPTAGSMGVRTSVAAESGTLATSPQEVGADETFPVSASSLSLLERPVLANHTLRFPAASLATVGNASFMHVTVAIVAGQLLLPGRSLFAGDLETLEEWIDLVGVWVLDTEMAGLWGPGRGKEDG